MSRKRGLFVCYESRICIGAKKDKYITLWPIGPCTDMVL